MWTKKSDGEIQLHHYCQLNCCVKNHYQYISVDLHNPCIFNLQYYYCWSNDACFAINLPQKTPTSMTYFDNGIHYNGVKPLHYFAKCFCFCKTPAAKQYCSLDHCSHIIAAYIHQRQCTIAALQSAVLVWHSWPFQTLNADVLRRCFFLFLQAACTAEWPQQY